MKGCPVSVGRIVVLGISLLLVAGCAGQSQVAAPRPNRSPVVSTVAATQRSPRRVLVVANCMHPSKSARVKPRRLIVDCGGDAIYTLTSVHYQRWAADTAHAHAIQRYNNCDPSCSAGNLINRRVSVRFFKPRVRGNRTYFACLVLTGGTDETSTLLGQQHAAACHVRGHISG
jgi:hypothetical protein